VLRYFSILCSFLVTALPAYAVKTTAWLPPCARQPEVSVRAGAGGLPEGLPGGRGFPQLCPGREPCCSWGVGRDVPESEKSQPPGQANRFLALRGAQAPAAQACCLRLGRRSRASGCRGSERWKSQKRERVRRQARV